MNLKPLILTLLITSTINAQDIFNNCGMEGDAKHPAVKILNLKKNRYEAPKQSDYDTKVTLSEMLAPGNDENRWGDTKAAEVIGYVYDVKPGGIESVNCHAKDLYYRDTHIELVLDPMKSDGTKRVIAEVTPRWREKMKAKGIDWTTKQLRKRFLGRWVKVQGWLMFDEEHKQQSENTNPGRSRNWRATAWEIHPVTNIEVR
jgi:hypothetical protein